MSRLSLLSSHRFRETRDHHHPPCWLSFSTSLGSLKGRLKQSSYLSRTQIELFRFRLWLSGLPAGWLFDTGVNNGNDGRLMVRGSSLVSQMDPSMPKAIKYKYLCKYKYKCKYEHKYNVFVLLGDQPKQPYRMH